jgi:hypothetical protein
LNVDPGGYRPVNAIGPSASAAEFWPPPAVAGRRLDDHHRGRSRQLGQCIPGGAQHADVESAGDVGDGFGVLPADSLTAGGGLGAHCPSGGVVSGALPQVGQPGQRRRRQRLVGGEQSRLRGERYVRHCRQRLLDGRQVLRAQRDGGDRLTVGVVQLRLQRLRGNSGVDRIEQCCNGIHVGAGRHVDQRDDLLGEQLGARAVEHPCGGVGGQRAVRQRTGAQAGRDGRRIPQDLPLFAVLGSAAGGGVGPLAAAVLAEFPGGGEAQRRFVVLAVDRGHLEVCILAETFVQLAQRVGRLPRIGRDGGGC